MPGLLLMAEFGAGRLGLYYERAFKRLGWKVARYDMGLRYTLPAPLPPNALLRRALRGLIWRKMNREIADLAKSRWDLVLAIKAPCLEGSTVDLLRTVCGPTIMIYPDNPWGRWTQRRDVLPVLTRFNRTYIWSRLLQDRLAKAGISGSRYLPFGYDPTDYTAGDGSDGAGCRREGFVFAGQPYPRRITWLKALEGLPVRIFGSGWRQSWFGGGSSIRTFQVTPMGADAAGIYRSALAGLNVMHEDNLAGHNMRSFEIPPTGALMIGDATEDVERHFPGGTASLTASSLGEFREKCRWVLESPEKARRIAEEGRRRGVTHTYESRAQEILQDLEW